MSENRWKNLKSIWVHCQRPGCDYRKRVPIEHLEQVDSECGSNVDHDGSIYSAMVELPDGWSVGMDPKGALYGACPTDTILFRHVGKVPS